MIFLRQFRGVGELPVNRQIGVVPANAALGTWLIVVGGFVEEFGGFGEDEEAVGETFRNPEGVDFSFIGEGLEMEAGPFAEVGGVAAEVDGYIPDMAGEDADELSLRLAKLVVETSEDSRVEKD